MGPKGRLKKIVEFSTKRRGGGHFTITDHLKLLASLVSKLPSQNLQTSNFVASRNTKRDNEKVKMTWIVLKYLISVASVSIMQTDFRTF